MKHEGLYKLSTLLDQFKEGLRAANILSLLESYPKEFASMFTFSGDIEAADVIEALYTTGEKDEVTIKFLHQYILNLSQEGIAIYYASTKLHKCTLKTNIPHAYSIAS